MALEQDDRSPLACNVFLSYQIALHRIAAEYTTWASLMGCWPARRRTTTVVFLDKAHPSAAAVGRRLIADASWARLQER